MQIPVQDQQKILAKLGDLPPGELFFQCHTAAQQAHWLAVREEMLQLRQELTAYFSGQDSVLPDLGEDDEHLEKLKDYLLALYELIRVCWQWIDPLLNAVLENKTMDYRITNPGDLFCLVLSNLAAAKVYPCLGYFVYRPRKMDELARLEKKIKTGYPVSNIQKSQYQKDLRAVTQGLDAYTHLITLIEMSSQVVIECNLHTNKVILNRWRQYKQAKQDLDKWNRAYNRKHKVRGFAWDKGQMIQSNRVGSYG